MGRRNLWEAAVDPRVINLYPRPVFIATHQGVASEEVGVGPIGASAEKARVKGAGTRGDQLYASPFGVASADFVGRPLGGPLI